MEYGQLFVAARTGNVEIPCIFPQDTNPQWTPLHIACMFGQVDFAREYLRRYPQNLQHENPNGCSGLHLASSNGHLEMIRLLLTLGHNRELCMKRDKDGRTPLHHAVINGSDRVVNRLLDACPESALEVTVHGETVFHLAVKNKVSVSRDLFEDLLRGPYAHKLLNMADKEGNTVLHLALVRKQRQIIERLSRERTLNVNAVNSCGLTPLDLLVIDPINFADRRIEKIIKSAGGVRLNESQERREEWKSVSSGLFVMASLIAAACCQIAVFLQVGFWEGLSPITSVNVTSVLNATASIQKPGNATLYLQNGKAIYKKYENLVLLDGIVFLFSIYIIILTLLPKFRSSGDLVKWIYLIVVTLMNVIFFTVLFAGVAFYRFNWSSQERQYLYFFIFVALSSLGVFVIPLVSIFIRFLLSRRN
ncbi:hypothetical protein P3X46_009650 [Hevea brasiliensis]|uniref:PGG domain-containing protein n=1 Tax=Hevea brasiliensis TaxID=3981 RepID=A0ABQ9MQ10_HEVBR|nr:ankyrin repeat-containing protein BDA1-like [Hevea brasiliensis]KAJ9181527.1 hypothetical protein P3X46_009650 [Hevea brasiliensis]